MTLVFEVSEKSNDSDNAADEQNLKKQTTAYKQRANPSNTKEVT